MSNPFLKYDIQALIEYIKQLPEIERRKIIEAFREDDLALVNEDAAIYLKMPVTKPNFEEDWDKSISSKEFKQSAIQHINTLPWK